MPRKVNLLTVSEVADQIESVIQDYLPPVYVEGEVSNYYKSRAGHIYLSLKDDNALINAVIWRYAANQLTFKIEDGMRVIIFGEIITYKLRSQYQIKVQSIKPSGLGNLYLAFEKLKKELEAKGLFDDAHKKKLPEYPTKIGVITSPTSAAVRDIIQVSGRRNSAVQLLVYPAVVQGDEAASTLIEGINYFNNAEEKVDLIILSRGGGSIEDLWAFNEEKVVQAVYESKLPIVTGIGHEIDFTLCDFASDYRAPTPSAAAEESIPELETLLEKFNHLTAKMRKAFDFKFEKTTIKIDHLEKQFTLLNPENMILNQIQHVDDLESRIKMNIKQQIVQYWEKLNSLSDRINSLNPESILKRGYSIVKDDKNNILKSVKNLHKNDKLSIKMADGNVQSTVLSVDRQKEESGNE